MAPRRKQKQQRKNKQTDSFTRTGLALGGLVNHCLFLVGAKNCLIGMYFLAVKNGHEGNRQLSNDR